MMRTGWPIGSPDLMHYVDWDEALDIIVRRFRGEIHQIPMGNE